MKALLFEGGNVRIWGEAGPSLHPSHCLTGEACRHRAWLLLASAPGLQVGANAEDPPAHLFTRASRSTIKAHDTGNFGEGLPADVQQG